VKPLKVYGWTGFRRECPAAPNGSRQTREIVAAKSWAEVARLSGVSLYHLKSYGSETGNDVELEVALASPRIVFWIPLNRRYNQDNQWTPVVPKEEKAE
jgi:hypothetical protein